MDPNAGGGAQVFRLLAPDAGAAWPAPAGRIKKKGEVLAYVNAGSRWPYVRWPKAVWQRLRELSDTVPRKAIEEAEAAVANEQLAPGERRHRVGQCRLGRSLRRGKSCSRSSTRNAC